ncbi:5-hydroxyisourate hydrolase-like isoform X2 [Candoia aspera]|uniref:5-hydroxyisourate hydrolase-like isoform X2 n=1 Tax=Candoia aspera TaxID=51853 RepID=UPI002FD7A900
MLATCAQLRARKRTMGCLGTLLLLCLPSLLQVLAPSSQLPDHNQTWMDLMTSNTSTDGRMDKSELASLRLEPGTYRLRFATGAYWLQQGRTSLYPYADVVFMVTAADLKLHIPLLLSPYSYITYRGN